MCLQPFPESFNGNLASIATYLGDAFHQLRLGLQRIDFKCLSRQGGNQFFRVFPLADTLSVGILQRDGLLFP